METPATQADTGHGGYMQWRPVCFQTKDRNAISDSTGMHHEHERNLTLPSKRLNQSLLYDFLGKKMNSYLVQGTNVTWGEGEDGFYTKTNYITW